MDYNVKIFASQASGFGDALTGVVKTRKTDVPLPQPLHVVLLLCFHCNSTPASTWQLVLIFLSIALSGWCFMERKVCSSLRAVVQRPGWQTECQNLAFKYTWWWRVGFPSGKSLLAFFTLSGIFQPACSLTWPTPVKVGPEGVGGGGSLPFLEVSAPPPLREHAHACVHTHTYAHTHLPSTKDTKRTFFCTF